MSRWLASAAMAVATACSNSSTGYGNNPPPPPPPPPGGHLTTITIANNSFSPTPDTIPAGTITFDWAANAVTHNVTWLTGPSTPTNSGDMGANGTYSTALVAGDYTYHCTHHSGMNGAIHVTP